MSISSEVSRNTYTGNGSTSSYSYTFRIFDEGDLLVTQVNNSNVETTLALTTNYTVSGVGDSGGGSISLVAGNLTSGYQLSIRRVMDLTQETEFRNQGDFFPEVHEDTFDRLVMIDQQQQDEIERCFRLPEVIDPDDVSSELPTPEANTFLAWNDDADALENIDAESFVTIAGSQNWKVDTYTNGVDFTAGSTTSLTLSAAPGSKVNTIVFYDGVYKAQSTYSLAGSTITFTAAITGGTTKVEIKYLQTLVVNTTAAENVSYVSGGTSATTRDVRTKLRELKSVTDFGCVGDGVTDDTTNLQRALTWLQSNKGKLEFPPGTYLFTSALTCYASDIHIFGDHATLKGNFNGLFLNLGGTTVGQEKENITVENLSFITPSSQSGQQGIQFNHVRNAFVERCRFEDLGISGVGGAGIKFNTNCQYVHALKNYFDNIGVIALYCEGDSTNGPNRHIWYTENKVINFNYGIEVKQSTDVFIDRNDVLTGQVGTTKYGIVCSRDYHSDEYVPERIHIRGNTVKDAAYAGINVTASVNFEISDNIVENSGNQAITGSGSFGNISNNRMYNCYTGLSAGFNVDVSSGTNGADATYFDKARMTISGNRALKTTTGESFSFNKTTDSHIINNTCEKQGSADYAFHFTDCDDTFIRDNVVKAGSHTFAFRMESSTNNGAIVGTNIGVAGSSGVWSMPTDYLGHIVEQNFHHEKYVARLRINAAGSATLFSYAMPDYGNGSTLYFKATVVSKSVSNSDLVDHSCLFVREFLASRFTASSGTAAEGTNSGFVDDSRDSGMDVAWSVSSDNVLLTATTSDADDVLFEAVIEIVKRED